MYKTKIEFESMTSAIKAKNLLFSYKIRSEISKIPKSLSNNGCGFALVVFSNGVQAKEILKNNGFSFVGKSDSEMP